jgi:acetylornithine deacetylase
LKRPHPHPAGRAPTEEEERRILEAVNEAALVRTASDLIAFESWGGREVEVQQHMAALYRMAALDVDCWEIDLDALSSHPAFGAEIERDRALGVVGRWGNAEGPTLILNGHVDVVPAGEGWTVPPFRGTVGEGAGGPALFGRGAADMKGAVACALHAVLAIQASGVRLAGSVLLHSVAGEEDGGLGTLAAIERGHVGDAAIVLEPTRLAVAPAQGGALSFRITLAGAAAHGALRTEGVNPIGKLGRIWSALEALEARRSHRLRHPLFDAYEVPFPLSPGWVQSGIWPSSVPERLVLEGRYGIGIGESLDAARAEFEAAVAEAAQGDPWLASNPPKVEWWGARFEPAAIPVDDPLVGLVGDAFQTVTGRDAPIEGMPYGADMHLLVNQAGIPTLLFGPGDIRKAHAPDEHVPIRELAEATRTITLASVRYCGVMDR